MDLCLNKEYNPEIEKTPEKLGGYRLQANDVLPPRNVV